MNEGEGARSKVYLITSIYNIGILITDLTVPGQDSIPPANCPAIINISNLSITLAAGWHVSGRTWNGDTDLVNGFCADRLLTEDTTFTQPTQSHAYQYVYIVSK